MSSRVVITIAGGQFHLYSLPLFPQHYFVANIIIVSFIDISVYISKIYEL